MPHIKTFQSYAIVPLLLLLILQATPGHVNAAPDEANRVAKPEVGDISRFDYQGRSPDAAWRKAANDRIEKYRKGDLTVEVMDEEGKPVQGADVQVRMKKHAFHFGSQVQVALICDETTQGEQYRKSFLEMFNYATVNSFYYMQWKYPGRVNDIRKMTYQTIDWMREHNIATRGHVLVWYLKDEQINKSKEEVRQLALDHINMKAGDTRIAAGIDQWDVQNEPCSNSDIFNKLGSESIDEWFRVTRNLDPTAKLMLNEAGLISRTDRDAWRERQNFTYDLVKELQSRDVSIDGLGLQSHHVESLADIDDVLAGLDRFAQLGIELQITEFDIKLIPAVAKGDYQQKWRARSATSPELLQLEGEYTRDFLTACFSHPSVTAFIMWGFWDGKHWLYNAPLYNEDWTLRPAGEQWRNLIYKEWWTDVDGKTDASGKLETRGFLGDYEITVRGDGVEKIANTTLTQNGTTVQVKLCTVKE